MSASSSLLTYLGSIVVHIYIVSYIYEFVGRVCPGSSGNSCTAVVRLAVAVVLAFSGRGCILYI